MTCVGSYLCDRSISNKDRNPLTVNLLYPTAIVVRQVNHLAGGRDPGVSEKIVRLERYFESEVGQRLCLSHVCRIAMDEDKDPLGLARHWRQC